MIPTSLSVRNFMCYRNGVEIDLRGVRVACLSGDNGAGKSALLDCMTWSIWGKARVNSDRELMALNATEMEVTFGFVLNEQEYRVTRRRTRGGAGPLVLELQVLDGETWRTLSGATARETQRAIDELLKMDYDTFINSAFILQGRADEFTTKTPALRKQVLAEILSLGDYDQYEEVARAEFRERERLLREYDARIESIDRRLVDLPRHHDDVARLSQELVALGERAEEAGERLTAVREQLSALEFIARERAAVQSEIGTLEAEIGTLEGNRRLIQERIARQRAILERRQEIEAQHQELQQVRYRHELFSTRLTERQELIARHREVERRIEQATFAVESELRSVADQLAQRAPLARVGPELAEQLTRVQRKTVTLPLVKKDLDELRAEQAKLEALRGELQAENRRLKHDMDELKARMDQITGADAVCPVCRRGLGPGERERIAADYQGEGKGLGDAFRGNQAKLKEIQADLKANAEDIAQLERQRAEIDALCRQEATLQERFKACELATLETAQLTERQQALEQTLRSGETTREERELLTGIERQLEAVPYDSAEHRAVQARIAELSRVEDEIRDLLVASTALVGDMQQLEMVDAGIQQRRDVRDDRVRRDAELAEHLKHHDELRAQHDVLATDLARIERQRGEKQEQFGAAQQRLNDCLRLEDERVEVLQERNRAAEEKAIHDELMLAFGKRGIQAMIIENIVPELQDEANSILDKMPGNTMRIEFQTQRQMLRGEGTIETLDIVISDEAGRRPYELYSGGEAFRANFAIRVALSTLLARRAGTRLQTLIIDEGFGTQDSRGRDGLIEAIHAIEQDFAMILVITHIPELKDLFPTRVDVVKTPDGSMVTVN